MKPWEMNLTVAQEPQKPWEMSQEQLLEATNKDIENEARGDNWGGAARNLAQGATFGFADEIEAGLGAEAQGVKDWLESLPEEEKARMRSDKKYALQAIKNRPAEEFERKAYDRLLQNARQSYKGYSKEHPVLATALNVAGGLVPSAIAMGATIPSAFAKGTMSLGSNMLRGGAISGLEGLIYGAGTGEGAKDRLVNAGWGGLLGAGVGAAVPFAVAGLGSIGNSIRRIIRSGQKAPTEGQIAETILKKVVEETGQSGAAAKRNANILFQAAQVGDEAIQDAAENLTNKIAARAGAEGVLELAPQPTWTAETPSLKRIKEAFDTPARRQASKEFGEFVAKQPEKTGAGLALNNFFKKNPDAKKIVSANQRRIGEELTSYTGLQKIEEVLRNNLPKSLDTGRAVNRNARILDALDDLDQLRNTLFPGQSKMDAMYRAAKQGVQAPAEKKATALLQQIASGVPLTQTPELSLTGAGRLAFKPWVRGRARELITTGKLYEGVPMYVHDPVRESTAAIMRLLQEQGRAKPAVDVQFGSEPLTDDPNAWYNRPVNY